MASLRRKYIILGESFLPREKQALEHSISVALVPASPSEFFVSDLEQQLIDEAKRHQQDQQALLQGLRVVGLIGGGLLSVVGGVLMWLLWRKHQPQDSEKQLIDATRTPLFRSAKLTKAQNIV
jgi:hypothetical protein